jgi:hypothetical protein
MMLTLSCSIVLLVIASSLSARQMQGYGTTRGESPTVPD